MFRIPNVGPLHPSNNTSVDLGARSGFDPILRVKTNSAINDSFLFWYFSIATQTTTGFGDITPVQQLPQLVSIFQVTIPLKQKCEPSPPPNPTR